MKKLLFLSCIIVIVFVYFGGMNENTTCEVIGTMEESEYYEIYGHLQDSLGRTPTDIEIATYYLEK